MTGGSQRGRLDNGWSTKTQARGNLAGGRISKQKQDCTLAQSRAALPGAEAGVGVNGITVWGERELSGQGTRWNPIVIKIATA